MFPPIDKINPMLNIMDINLDLVDQYNKVEQEINMNIDNFNQINSENLNRHKKELEDERKVGEKYRKRLYRKTKEHEDLQD